MPDHLASSQAPCNRGEIHEDVANIVSLRVPSYALQWMIVLPLEIIAASMTIGYWNAAISKSIFVFIFLLFIIVINLFGVKGYGEAEFAFAIIKVTAVIGFM